MLTTEKAAETRIQLGSISAIEKPWGATTHSTRLRRRADTDDPLSKSGGQERSFYRKAQRQADIKLLKSDGGTDSERAAAQDRVNRAKSGAFGRYIQRMYLVESGEGTLADLAAAEAERDAGNAYTTRMATLRNNMKILADAKPSKQRKETATRKLIEALGNPEVDKKTRGRIHKAIASHFGKGRTPPDVEQDGVTCAGMEDSAKSRQAIADYYAMLCVKGKRNQVCAVT